MVRRSGARSACVELWQLRRGCQGIALGGDGGEVLGDPMILVMTCSAISRTLSSAIRSRERSDGMPRLRGRLGHRPTEADPRGLGGLTDRLRAKSSMPPPLEAGTMPMVPAVQIIQPLKLASPTTWRRGCPQTGALLRSAFLRCCGWPDLCACRAPSPLTSLRLADSLNESKSAAVVQPKVAIVSGLTALRMISNSFQRSSHPSGSARPMISSTSATSGLVAASVRRSGHGDGGEDNRAVGPGNSRCRPHANIRHVAAIVPTTTFRPVSSVYRLIFTR